VDSIVRSNFNSVFFKGQHQHLSYFPFRLKFTSSLPGGSSTTKAIASNFEQPSETILNRLILMVLGKRLRQSILIGELACVVYATPSARVFSAPWPEALPNCSRRS
jgi:hypothetical protein